MNPAFLFLVYALAVARVAVLVTEDRITETPREALLARLRVRARVRCLTRSRAAWEAAAPDQPWTTQTAGDFRTLCDRDTPDPYLAYLLTCQWCVSVWAAAVAAPLWYWAGDNPWLLVPAAALAFSYITGKLSQLGG